MSDTREIYIAMCVGAIEINMKNAGKNEYTDEECREYISQTMTDAIVASIYAKLSDSDKERVFKQIREKFPEQIVMPISIVNESAHDPGWFAGLDKEKKFWNRFKKYMESDGNTAILMSLDKISDSVMKEIGNPNSNGVQRYGMLWGDVQSGKTMLYTAIMNKAADAGYRHIVVLTGCMESLRRQTQRRLDRDLIGISSKHHSVTQGDIGISHNKYIGVGEYDKENRCKIISYTTEEKDIPSFIVKRPFYAGSCSEDATIIYVVKKIKLHLLHLSNYLRRLIVLNQGSHYC